MDKKLLSAARCRVEEGVNGCLGPGCDVIEEQVGMQFQTSSECGLGEIR